MVLSSLCDQQDIVAFLKALKLRPNMDMIGSHTYSVVVTVSLETLVFMS